jgi:hypothetical protein
MDHPAENPKSHSARDEVVYTGGRMAVLVLFTALFAAAWNGDGRPAGALTRSGALPRQAGRLALAAAEVGTIRNMAVGPIAGLQLGSGIRLACDDRAPGLPFTGTPALLGGTIRSGEATPVASSEAEGRL